MALTPLWNQRPYSLFESVAILPPSLDQRPYPPFGIRGLPLVCAGSAAGRVQPLYSPCVYQTLTAHQSTPTDPRARLLAIRDF